MLVMPYGPSISWLSKSAPMAIHHGKSGTSVVSCIAVYLSLMTTVVDSAKPAAIAAPVRTQW